MGFEDLKQGRSLSMGFRRLLLLFGSKEIARKDLQRILVGAWSYEQCCSTVGTNVIALLVANNESGQGTQPPLAVLPLAKCGV